MFRSKPRSGASSFRANMWALKNKSTGIFLTEVEAACLDGYRDEYPMLFTNRNAARSCKTTNQSVVKVAVTVRKAA